MFSVETVKDWNAGFQCKKRRIQTANLCDATTLK